MLMMTILGPESDTSFSIEKCNDIYKVTYIPLEIGVFDVKILWNGQEIPSLFFTFYYQCLVSNVYLMYTNR